MKSIFLSVGVALLVGNLMGFVSAQDAKSAQLFAKAQTVHAVLWSRFIGSEGIMYDYAGLKGEVLLPTPEECRDNKPNALAWWTPIENGAFFNGIYLLALCQRYEMRKEPEIAANIRTLVAGLYRLQDVASVPGFLARGTGAGGKAHYPASSDDQNFPWLLGLWRYLKTDIPTAAERQECGDRIRRHVAALEQNRWIIVGDQPGFERGAWRSSENRACVALVMTMMIMFDTTGEQKWRQEYLRVLNEKMHNGLTRREIIAKGVPIPGAWGAWFTATAQYAVRELWRSESDPALKAEYAGALRVAAESAVAAIELYQKFDASQMYAFTPDWRLMLTAWAPQTKSSEAQKVAEAESALWNNECPAIREEKAWLKPAMAGAWMVLMSEDPELIAKVRPKIVQAVDFFTPERYYYATFFYLENVVYELQAQGQR